MTLITRLSTAFTDTTLPILRKDPVLPVTALTGAGDRVLYDWKNAGTWPSQAGTIATGANFFSLGDSTVPGVGDGVAASFNATYNPTNGKVISDGDFFLEDNYDDIFSDPTADYVVSLWMSIESTGFYPAYMQKGISNLNSNQNSFVIYGGNNQQTFEWYQPAATDTDSRANFFIVPSSLITLGVVNRFGIHWTKSSGSWRLRGVFNNNTPGAYRAMTHGTGADGIQLNSAWKLKLHQTFPGLARFYVENLSVSGRTAEEVWAADWARGNGRFS